MVADPLQLQLDFKNPIRFPDKQARLSGYCMNHSGRQTILICFPTVAPLITPPPSVAPAHYPCLPNTKESVCQIIILTLVVENSGFVIYTSDI